MEFIIIIYILAAIINIISIQREKFTVRLVSKICLMPSLSFFYIINSDNLSFFIIMAIVLSWWGDILLVNPGKAKLYAGISCFLAAYILYILEFVYLAVEIDILYKSIAGILLVAGTVSFIVSDAVLAYFNLVKAMTKNPLTVVMSSYIIAQACIIIGYIYI